MAINVDRVYRTVQRILNVEERGQLPEEDFNYIANLAQLDLFNRLFYDEPHFALNPKTANSPIPENIEDMIDVFRSILPIQISGTTFRGFRLPSNLYRLDVVYSFSEGTERIVEKIEHEDFTYINNSRLTRPTVEFPKYLRYSNAPLGIAPPEDLNGLGLLRVLPDTINEIIIEYIRRPSLPRWNGRAVATGEILYNQSDSNDFDLHPAMEQDLILRILVYAGISIRQEGVSQAIAAIIQGDEQLEKS